MVQLEYMGSTLEAILFQAPWPILMASYRWVNPTCKNNVHDICVSITYLIAGLAVSFPTHLLLESCDVTWWAWLLLHLLHLLLPHSDGSLTALSVCCVPTHGDPVWHLGAAHQSWNDLGIPLGSCLDCVGIPDSIKSLGQLKHWDESLLAQIRDILCYCTVIYPVMTLCMTLDYTHIGALVPFLGHQYKAVYITDTVSEDMWYALQYNTIELLGLGVDQMLRRFPLES